MVLYPSPWLLSLLIGNILYCIGPSKLSCSKRVGCHLLYIDAPTERILGNVQLGSNCTKKLLGEFFSLFGACIQHFYRSMFKNHQYRRRISAISSFLRGNTINFQLMTFTVIESWIFHQLGVDEKNVFFDPP